MAAIERNPSASQADPDVIDALKGIGVALLSDQLRRNRGTKELGLIIGRPQWPGQR